MNIRIVYSAFYMILDSLNNSSLFTQTIDEFAMFICMYAFFGGSHSILRDKILKCTSLSSIVMFVPSPHFKAT